MTDTYVRWTAKDAEGSFSYEGRLIPNKKGQFPGFSMETEIGIMRIPANDGVVKKIRKPTGFRINTESKYKPQVRSNDVKPVEVEKVIRSHKKGTKKIRAMEIYKQYSDRQEAIAQIMEQLDMSKAGATTYYYNCKNESQ